MENDTSDQPKKRGRPAGQVLTEDVRVRFEPDVLDAIDARRKSLGLATRSAFIRYAVAQEIAK